MPTFKLGKDGVAYFGAEDADLATLVEVPEVKDVVVNMGKGLADGTTRGGGGWRQQRGTLKEMTVEFTANWAPGDSGVFDAMMTSYLTDTIMEWAFLDGSKAVSGSEGPKGGFSVTQMNRNEPLEEAMTVDVVLVLSDYDQWITAAPS